MIGGLMRKRAPFTDKELYEYSDIHLKYEVDMLKWTASMYRYLSAPAILDSDSLPTILKNSLLESFVMHARSLTEFLYHSPKEGLVTAREYLDEHTLNLVRPEQSELLKRAYGKASEEAVHLSADRIERYRNTLLGTDLWSYLDIARDILQALIAIVPSIPPTKFSTALRHDLSHSPLFMPMVDVALGRDASGKTDRVTFLLPDPMGHTRPPLTFGTAPSVRGYTGPVKH
jgi:hypothetical protein